MNVLKRILLFILRAFAWTFAGLVTCFGLFWLWSVIEIKHTYTPWCYTSGKRHKITGPLRETYILKMSSSLELEGLDHAVEDGKITYWANTGPLFLNGYYDDFFKQNQAKVVSGITEGVTVSGVYYPPPKASLDAIEATEHIYGPYPKYRNGNRVWGNDPRFDDCALMPAAILRDPSTFRP